MDAARALLFDPLLQLSSGVRQQQKSLPFMQLSAYTLAEALASRLNALVPASIHILVERVSGDADVIVRVANGTEPWGGQGFSNLDLRPHSGLSLDDMACNMAIAILSGVQDSVSRILREPWPRLTTGDMALPAGRADSARIYLWYGPAGDRAAITLRPIEVADISL